MLKLKKNKPKTRLFATAAIPKIALINCKCVKTVQVIRQCRIRLVVHFLFLRASLKKFGFSPKTNPFLGAATYGSKAGIHLGRRNLRLPRRNSSWGIIQSVFDMLSEIGNAQLNVFCTVFSATVKSFHLLNGGGRGQRKNGKIHVFSC